MSTEFSGVFWITQDLRVVKDMMRHESVATTQIYTRTNMGQQQGGIVVLPWHGEMPAAA